MIDGQAGRRAIALTTRRAPLRGVPGSPLPAAARGPRGTLVCLCVRLCVLGERLLTCLGAWGCWVSSDRDQCAWQGCRSPLLEAVGCVWRGCVASICVLRWALLSRPGLRGCFTLVPGLRMAVLVCLRAERVAAVSRTCAALLAFLGVLCRRAMGLSA